METTDARQAIMKAANRLRQAGKRQSQSELEFNYYPLCRWYEGRIIILEIILIL